MFIKSRSKGCGASKWVVIVSNKHKVVTSDPSRLSGMTALVKLEIQRHLRYGNAIKYSVVKNYTDFW